MVLVCYMKSVYMEEGMEEFSLCEFAKFDIFGE